MAENDFMFEPLEPVGMCDQQIKEIAEIEHTQDSEQKTCAICLDDFSQGQRLKQLICEHRFHVDCVDIWLRSKPSCPLCRKSLIPAQEEIPPQEEENQNLYNDLDYLYNGDNLLYESADINFSIASRSQSDCNSSRLSQEEQFNQQDTNGLYYNPQEEGMFDDRKVDGSNNHIINSNQSWDDSNLSSQLDSSSDRQYNSSIGQIQDEHEQSPSFSLKSSLKSYSNSSNQQYESEDNADDDSDN